MTISEWTLVSSAFLVLTDVNASQSCIVTEYTAFELSKDIKTTADEVDKRMNKHTPDSCGGLRVKSTNLTVLK